MSLEIPAQIMEHLSDDQGIGVLVPKPGGGHSLWLDVGVAATFGDDQDHLAAESTMVLILPAVVPLAFRNTKTLQGIDQKAGEAWSAWNRQESVVSVCVEKGLSKESSNVERLRKRVSILGVMSYS